MEETVKAIMGNMVNNNGEVLVSSRVVAQDFGKRHDNVKRDIENLLKSDYSILSNQMFTVSMYENRGKQCEEYLMNRDGFSLLVMGFTGKEALRWKLDYIEAFNEMERQLQEIKNVIDGKGELTKDEFYDIHFGNGKRIRRAFEETDDYAKTFSEFLEFAKTLDVDERIKRYEHLQRVLNDILTDKVRDLSLSVSQVMDVRITLGDMLLKLEEKINEAKNRSYGAKLKFAKRK